VRRSASTLGVLAVLAAVFAPAATARQTVTVQVSVHLRSHYTSTIDHTDSSDPSCVIVSKGTSDVIADMPTDRPSVFTVTRVRHGALWTKHLGGTQRETLGVDMHVHMTRSQDMGGTTDCHGFEPFPSDGCGSRSWIIRGRVDYGHGRLLIDPQVTVESLDSLMADDNWRMLACGWASDAEAYDSYVQNGPVVQKGYEVSLPLTRLFAASPRLLTLHGHSTFTVCCPDTAVGGWTEVRTTTITIRKLRL
jgi:hypothetical protein